MTFKDLRKRISNTEPQLQQQQQQTRLFDICKDKPFWIWDQNQHRLEDISTKGYCCFNHIVGLPSKGRIEKPLFDYEKPAFSWHTNTVTMGLLYLIIIAGIKKKERKVYGVTPSH